MMKMLFRNLALLLILLLVPLKNSTAQNVIPDFHEKGISIGVMGYILGVGVSMENYVTENVSVSASAGILGAGIDAKYHFRKPSEHKFNYYAGLAFMSFYEGVPAYYTPVGVSYTGSRNFQYSLDMGLFYSVMADPELGPNLNLRAGYRFGNGLLVKDKKGELPQKNFVNLTFGYPITMVLSYERMLTPWLGAEAMIGFLSAGGSVRVYTPGLCRSQLGFHAGITHIFSAFIEPSTFLSIGPHYIFKNGIRLGAEAIPGWKEPNNPDGLSFIGASFRLGKSF